MKWINVNFMSFKGFILAFSLIVTVWNVVDGNGIEGVEFLLPILLLPAIMIFFNDFSEKVFRTKIEIIFVFAALVPIAFDPVIDLLKNNNHEFFLYTILSVSMIVFLFVYMTKYVEWMAILAYLALLVFTSTLLYTSVAFISFDLFCDKNETMIEGSFCSWTDETIDQQDLKESISG